MIKFLALRLQYSSYYMIYRFNKRQSCILLKRDSGSSCLWTYCNILIWYISLFGMRIKYLTNLNFC